MKIFAQKMPLYWAIGVFVISMLFAVVAWVVTDGHRTKIDFSNAPDIFTQVPVDMGDWFMDNLIVAACISVIIFIMMHGLLSLYAMVGGGADKTSD